MRGARERFARGYLSLAKTILVMIGHLARSATPVLLSSRCAPKVASMLLHFFAQLCVSENAARLDVRDAKAKYGFDRVELLSLIVDVAVPLAPERAFVRALNRDYAYDAELMRVTLAALQTEAVCSEQSLQRLSDMTAAVARLHTPPPVERDSDAKRARHAPGDDAASTGDSKSAADAGGSIGEQPLLSSEQLAAMERVYLRRLEHARFGDAAMLRSDNRGYAHHFATQISHTSAAQPGTARMERIVGEAESLSTSLPLTLTSAVFVRVDEDRMDVLKVRSSRLSQYCV